MWDVYSSESKSSKLICVNREIAEGTISVYDHSWSSGFSEACDDTLILDEYDDRHMNDENQNSRPFQHRYDKRELKYFVFFQQIKPKALARLYKGTREEPAKQKTLIRTVSDLWNAFASAARRRLSFIMWVPSWEG